MEALRDLPTGTVTFLFTDVEGSTRLWEEHPEAMKGALARHDELLRDAVEGHRGHVVKTMGDGVLAAFPTAADGVVAALDAQTRLTTEDWGEIGRLTVRMGLHTGAPQVREGDYFGSVLNRAARLMGVAHGGQVLVSEITQQLARDTLPTDVEMLDLGEHRLRDLAESLRVFQIARPGLSYVFPPLRSVDEFSGNLPTQVSTFVGRVEALARLEDLLANRRLITLTGVGGVGKTRLALQAAADCLPRFPGGAWFVELARTGDPSAVPAVATEAIGAVPEPGRSDFDVVCDHLASSRSLVVLDNCEHVLDAAADLVTALLERCPEVIILTTSREPLDVDGEQVFPVRPLDPATDAVSLFIERAQSTDPDFHLDRASEAIVRGICERLDGVPLCHRARRRARRRDVARRHRVAAGRSVPFARVR